jgi:hypothetical protein
MMIRSCGPSLGQRPTASSWRSGTEAPALERPLVTAYQLKRWEFPRRRWSTIAFKDLAKTNAAKRGMPTERIVFTPHPIWGKSDAEMYAYLEGNDPVTGKPLMKEVIAQLTDPLTPDDQKSGTMTPSVGPPTFVDTLDNLQRYYRDNGMTDFMPIIIPTEEKVDAMLKVTSHSPDEVIGELTPARGSFPAWKFTVKQVAINAVMAGADPSALPIILAISASGLPSLSSSTNSFATAVIVNGPIRDKLNMNYGIGAMGPFNDVNASIGRAWTLLSKNLGNCGLPGETYMGTQGELLQHHHCREREGQSLDSVPRPESLQG